MGIFATKAATAAPTAITCDVDQHPSIKAAAERLDERIAAINQIGERQEARQQELSRLRAKLQNDEANWLAGDVSETSLTKLRTQIEKLEAEAERDLTKAQLQSRIADAREQFESLKRTIFRAEIWPEMKQEYDEAVRAYAAAIASVIEANTRLQQMIDAIGGRVGVPVHAWPELKVSPQLAGFTKADHIVRELKEAGYL